MIAKLQKDRVEVGRVLVASGNIILSVSIMIVMGMVTMLDAKRIQPVVLVGIGQTKAVAQEVVLTIVCIRPELVVLADVVQPLNV